jgi:hypothetical protein
MCWRGVETFKRRSAFAVTLRMLGARRYPDLAGYLGDDVIAILIGEPI